MKKTFGKICSLVLSLVLLITCLVPVNATSGSALTKEGMSEFMENFRRTFSIIAGSYNEKADFNVKVKKRPFSHPSDIFSVPTPQQLSSLKTAALFPLGSAAQRKAVRM